MKSNNNFIKVSDSFEKINNNFLSFSDATDYKHQATRKGIAFKTIFLLLITALTAVAFFSYFKKYSLSIIYLIEHVGIYYSLLGLSFITSIVYLIAMSQVQIANLLACLFSVIEGFAIAICFYFINSWFYVNLLEIVFIAFFGTIAILCLMAHAYYKGILKVTNRFRNIMRNITISLFFSYLVRISLSFFGIWELENILYSVLAIPISLAMLIFLSMYLAIHFDYADHMIQQGMPEKYEWQVSLAFAVALIGIFLRIVSILLRIMGKDRK